MAVETVRPTSAVSAVWNVSTVGNVDDVVTQPTAGDGLRIRYKTSASQAQQYNMTNPSTAGTMTSVTIWYYGRVPDPDYIAQIQLIRIRLNGTWYSSGAMTLEMASSYTWYSTTISVSGELNGCSPILEFTGKGIDGSNSELEIDVAYADITYTPTVTEQYAVKSGNWNDTTVWSTGAVPTTGDVFSNNYTVTVNVNASATKVTNKAGTVAVAGGSFVLSNGVTLTANVEAGATTCVTSATGVTAGITGNVTGGTDTSAYGFNKSGTGTLTVTGSVTGGTGASAAGGINTGSGTVAISGSVYGNDSTSTGYGYRTTSSGTTTIGGSVYAGAAASGVFITSTGAVTVNGSVYATGSVVGMVHSGSGNSVTVTGNAVGGTTVLAYGVQCTSSGNLTVTGAAISPASPGIGAGVGVTGTGYATIGTAQTGTGGGSPCVGHVHVADLSAFTYLVRSSSSSVTLSADADISSPFSAPAVFGGA